MTYSNSDSSTVRPPTSALLARIGGGVIWAAALLAALMPVERLVGPDAESGVLDQLSVRGFSMPVVAAAKIGFWESELGKQYSRSLEVPLSSSLKMVMAVSKIEGAATLGEGGVTVRPGTSF